MKREHIKTIFDNIKPDTSEKERMLKNILDYSEKKRKKTMSSFNLRKALPAIALTVVFVVGILTYDFKDKIFNRDLHNNGKPGITQEDMIGEDSLAGREDMVAPLLNQFQIGNRHYMLMSDYVEEFGFPAVISDKDIGSKITTIEKSPDKSLIGCDVFYYLPAGCEAIVAVKRNNEYVLFKFYAFESYLNNQDEDAIEYLKLYGIESPDDIAKIQFIVYDEISKREGFNNIKSEITDRNEIANFYNFFSVLKNSSDKYFEKLFGYNRAEDSGEVKSTGNSGYIERTGNSSNVEIDAVYPADIKRESIDSSDKRSVEHQLKTAEPISTGSIEPIPPDYTLTPGTSQGMAGNMIDMGNDMIGNGETSPATVAPSQGSTGNALAEPVTIRIYNQNGVYFETMYYKNIGFLSRYEINNEFASFIESYIK